MLTATAWNSTSRTKLDLKSETEPQAAASIPSTMSPHLHWEAVWVPVGTSPEDIMDFLSTIRSGNKSWLVKVELILPRKSITIARNSDLPVR